MRTLLLALLPDDALILAIIAIGIGLIIGVFSRRAAFGYVGMIVLYALLAPFIDALFDILPLWLVLLILTIFLLGIARAGLNMLFGRRATDTFVGLLMWNFFALPFRFLGYLLGIRRR